MTKAAMLTAQRYPGKPLKQPKYNMQNVPYCTPNLEGSCILEISDREVFNEAMAEMVLLSKEAMRRKFEVSSVPSASQQSKSKITKIKRTSKPLSLEYIADRIDIDDPIFGFMVRTSKHIMPTIVDGMLQGFITLSTFTTWQKTFRWDSLHESAFGYDEPQLAAQMASGERLYDADGSLAAEMQATVHCGDPWKEGIVWPRIAEISLLSGLGCGRTLLSLVIERLECMAASATQNYDYLVLHATQNSIPFYESMGFVRVGAVTEDIDKGRNAEKADIESSQSTSETNVMCSPTLTYWVKSEETASEISNRFNVDVWDVIFLNHLVYPGINTRSILRKNTCLLIPDNNVRNAADKKMNVAGENEVQWYCAKNNETPKQIAKKFNISSDDLIAANSIRISDLCLNSKLIEGTKIQVSNFETKHGRFVPFCHWTFPDESFENTTPSYMMAKRLDRRNRSVGRERPVENSLAVPIVEHVVYQQKLSRPKKNSKSSKRIPQPKKRLCGTNPRKETLPVEQTAFDDEVNNLNLTLNDAEVGSAKGDFFDKIVKLTDKGRLIVQSEYEFFYVLTYIPDLFWCHLAPLRKVGIWGSNKPKAEGRPIWMLVHEEEGQEIDISGAYCETVKAKAMKGGSDADKEQWDIYESGSDTTSDNRFHQEITCPPVKFDEAKISILVENSEEALSYSLSTEQENENRKRSNEDEVSSSVPKRQRGRPRKLVSPSFPMNIEESEESYTVNQDNALTPLDDKSVSLSGKMQKKLTDIWSQRGQLADKTQNLKN